MNLIRIRAAFAASSLALAGLLTSTTAMAQASPVGLWKTVDEATKAERSQVRISESGGVFTGKIEKILTPGQESAVCEACTDGRKGKPIVGLTIIEGIKKSADEPYWEGGQILDPTSGKTYKLRLAMQDGGKTMQVRGYAGPFFRTQVWIRVE